MKIRHLRWYVAALLFAATVINYVDRQVLSIVAPVLTRELNLSPVDYANILQAFLYAYTVMYVVSGVIVDRWGTRLAQRPLHDVVGRWRTCCTPSPPPRSRSAHSACCWGIGEPGNFMAATKVTSEWFPPQGARLRQRDW